MQSYCSTNLTSLGLVSQQMTVPKKIISKDKEHKEQPGTDVNITSKELGS